jgi:hypothetical protein
MYKLSWTFIQKVPEFEDNQGHSSAEPPQERASPGAGLIAMRLAAISLLLGVSVAAGTAAGADTLDPTPPPIDQDYCARRDLTPEQYQEKCVIKNGPPHRHLLRRRSVRGTESPSVQQAPMDGSGSSSNP